ncbi:CoA pyrophosphatase [Tibeticola sp.]|jgi:8-oxo-dGTP pyrophosphatase MutT (NUDIX family)|uniref:CoA pyrophosphatase n=1 Tax=Tibeticola sp. TaxID=2005368 RepID=UPI0025873926|nr:CoA pyrophosphatase [Tibeticola sp.]MCI4439658.1 CoA pyrophosphatase [Tibeticola sp.]
MRESRAIRRPPPSFNPREVPVIGVDAHLPRVDPAELTLDRLRRRFQSPPTWVPELRAEPQWLPGSLKPAAVLIPLLASRGRDAPVHVLLTERAGHLSSHAGQIAFPGGRIDEGDADPIMAALREAQEEVGLDPTRVEALGLMPTYTTGSGYLVTPVVGLVDPSAPLRANSSEVSDIFEVPLDFLMNPQHHQRHSVAWQGAQREWFSMPYLDRSTQPPRERFIWGATAGMLRNLYRMLSAPR